MFLKRPILFLGLVVATGLSLSLRGEPPADDKEVRQLIHRLGSKSFKVREEAERQLLERENAAPALQRILQTPGTDREVARRATQILVEFQRRERRRALERLQSLGKQGEIDQVIERFVRRREWEPQESPWRVLAEIAGELVRLEIRSYGQAELNYSDRTPFGDLTAYRVAVQPETVEDTQVHLRKSGLYLVRGESVKGPLLGGLIASSGDIQAATLGLGAVFSGGSVTATDVNRCVVVCDGDFKARRIVHGSLIIVRGVVEAPALIHNSTIISASTVHVPKGATVKNSVIKEKDPNPLGFVKFFDPARAGIEVNQADGGVRIKAATEGKRFARAGLKAGDVIATIDGEAIKDPESFRRLLRRKLAEGGKGKLNVRRGEKTLEVRISWKD
ncbi:MAG: PDZ domain-containing protein [Planctomycetes bacterium]|nr:PDZ domain-containing protein [Planctomycetota bacterium]